MYLWPHLVMCAVLVVFVMAASFVVLAPTVLVMAEFFTCLFSWEVGNFSFSIGVFNGTNCFSNQIKLYAMTYFNVSAIYPQYYAFSNQSQFYIRFYYFLKLLI